jgi:hypothetical protein
MRCGATDYRGRQVASSRGELDVETGATPGRPLARPGDHQRKTVQPPLPSKTVQQLPKGPAADILRAQAPILEAATAIQELAAAPGNDGFTGTAIRDGKLLLYWHGQVPRALTYLSGEAPGPGEPTDGPTTPGDCVGGAGVGPPVLVL